LLVAVVVVVPADAGVGAAEDGDVVVVAPAGAPDVVTDAAAA
jgi:hypothetical protein